jgi:hypothetical protein
MARQAAKSGVVSPEPNGWGLVPGAVIAAVGWGDAPPATGGALGQLSWSGELTAPLNCQTR